MRGGGTFNCWTEKKVNTYLESVTDGGVHVERGWSDSGKPRREEYATFGEYSRECDRRWGYVCFDKHRPGVRFWGKSPKDAAINAGFTLIK